MLSESRLLLKLWLKNPLKIGAVAASSPELAAATQFAVQGALQQWLGDLILIEAVRVEGEEATLRVEVQYVVRRTQQSQTAQFTRSQ